MNPARMCLESLDRRPGIREQPGSNSEVAAGPLHVFRPKRRRSLERSACPISAPITDVPSKLHIGSSRSPDALCPPRSPSRHHRRDVTMTTCFDGSNSFSTWTHHWTSLGCSRTDDQDTGHWILKRIASSGMSDRMGYLKQSGGPPLHQMLKLIIC
jgi:hypothetical protein